MHSTAQQDKEYIRVWALHLSIVVFHGSVIIHAENYTWVCFLLHWDKHWKVFCNCLETICWCQEICSSLKMNITDHSCGPAAYWSPLHRFTRSLINWILLPSLDRKDFQTGVVCWYHLAGIAFRHKIFSFRFYTIIFVFNLTHICMRFFNLISPAYC